MSIQVNKLLLSESVTNYLRRQILLGQYKTGYHLSEVKLSEELQVSRGPVREAISRLENEGLVETKRNGRTIVIGFTLKDVIDLFETRKALELKAIETILDKQLNGNVLCEMNALVEEMKKQTDVEEILYLDHSYHYKLMDLSKNRTLVKLWSSISGLFITLTKITNTSFGNLQHLNDVHEKLILAIHEGNKESARKLIIRHIDEGTETIGAYLKNEVKGTYK